VPDHPGDREQDIDRMRAWLAASAALDAVIEATELKNGERPYTLRPLPPALVAAYRQDERPSPVPARRLRAARARS